MALDEIDKIENPVEQAKARRKFFEDNPDLAPKPSGKIFGNYSLRSLSTNIERSSDDSEMS